MQCGPLTGIRVPPERAPTMIDEYPILAVAAACAEGKTIFEGVSELRLKESDRLDSIARGLRSCKVEVDVTDDRLTIYGKGKPPWGGGQISSNMDHRIAMAFLVLGMATEKPIVVDDAIYIDTSFPSFITTMNGFGGNLKVEKNL
jgi:3-phosphoshikimate 1-carboxyvinyltransferase